MINIIKMTIILTLFCVVSAGALAYVNTLTQPIIKKRALLEEDSARRNLLMEVK